jgi:chaperone required for assembly of F1-ATPase
MNKETLRMQMLAGIITESQYKEKTENIHEDALNPEEKNVFNDIVNTLNEGEGWLEKLKSYAKKGMITLGIMAALLGGMSLNSNQKQEVVNTVKTEMPAQNKELIYRQIHSLST